MVGARKHGAARYVCKGLVGDCRTGLPLGPSPSLYRTAKAAANAGGGEVRSATESLSRDGCKGLTPASRRRFDRAQALLLLRAFQGLGFDRCADKWGARPSRLPPVRAGFRSQSPPTADPAATITPPPCHDAMGRLALIQLALMGHVVYCATNRCCIAPSGARARSLSPGVGQVGIHHAASSQAGHTRPDAASACASWTASTLRGRLRTLVCVAGPLLDQSG